MSRVLRWRERSVVRATRRFEPRWDRRWRLVRLTAIENGLLAVAGGCIGMLLAAVAVSWLKKLEGIDLPRLATISIDWRVWLFAAGASLLAASLLGALPVMRATMVRLAPSLRLDTRTSTGPGSHLAETLVGRHRGWRWRCCS